MKHQSCLLIIQCLIHITLHSAGFVGDTLILTDQGNIPLATIQPPTAIIAQNGNHQNITAIRSYTTDHAIAIHAANETVICDQNQLFWCANKNSWTKAALLDVDDTLLTYDKEIISIDAITYLAEKTTVYSLSVTQPHHLFVGQRAILAHNFAPEIAPAIVAGVTVCWGAGVEIVATISAGLVFCGTLFGLTWGKKNNESVVCTPTFSRGNENAPLFNYCTPTFRHGIYEDSPKHGAEQRGNVSPRPKNGQKALDNSVQIKDTSPGRIGISDDPFVILSKTRDKVYHGHVREWKDLEPEMRNAVKDAGWVTSKGKIKCKN